MIFTKSISRFARNTVDCLNYIRELKGMNIPGFFEKDSINIMDAKGEVLLTIMTSLAQQKSKSLSQNVKLGLQYGFQQGKMMATPTGWHSDCLRQSSLARQHDTQNPGKRKVHGRCTAAKDLHSGFSPEKACGEYWYHAAILHRRAP